MQNYSILDNSCSENQNNQFYNDEHASNDINDYYYYEDIKENVLVPCNTNQTPNYYNHNQQLFYGVNTPCHEEDAEKPYFSRKYSYNFSPLTDIKSSQEYGCYKNGNHNNNEHYDIQKRISLPLINSSFDSQSSARYNQYVEKDHGFIQEEHKSIANGFPKNSLFETVKESQSLNNLPLFLTKIQKPLASDCYLAPKNKISKKKEKLHQCPKCLKNFPRPSSLNTHMYTHTGEKPFECPEINCFKRFSVMSNLRRHIKVHSNRKLKIKMEKLKYEKHAMVLQQLVNGNVSNQKFPQL